jgi:hypothetical protein
MKWQACFFLIGLVVVSLSSGAVSRVGGGTLSNSDMMFSTPVPTKFKATVLSDNGDVRMEGPRSISLGSGLPVGRQTIQIFMLSNERPELANVTDRLQIKSVFNSQGWTRMHHPLACVEWFEKDSDNGLTSTLLWGAGHGVIFTGSMTSDTVQAIGELSRQLVNGDCGWK